MPQLLVTSLLEDVLRTVASFTCDGESVTPEVKAAAVETLAALEAAREVREEELNDAKGEVRRKVMAAQTIHGVKEGQMEQALAAVQVPPAEVGVELSLLQSLLPAVRAINTELRGTESNGEDEEGKYPTRLHLLVRGSRPFHPQPKRAKKDPRVARRLARLKEAYENRQYQRMVKKINAPEVSALLLAPVRSVADAAQHIQKIKQSMQMKSSYSQMSVGINIIVSMATAFVGGYFVGNQVFGDQVLGMCAGIICCIIMMMVDMWLFVINGNTLQKHVDKQKKLKAKGSKIAPSYQGLVKYS